MRYNWATASHQGMVRDNNEDAVFPTSSGDAQDRALVIVADGMGGHVAGEVASRIAINVAASSDLDPSDRVAAGNRAIREEVAREPSLEGMGTTMTLLSIEDETATVGHIGDSRAYLLRDGEFTQLTDDHTVAAEYVAIGQLDPSEAARHPQRHMLTRTLGLTRFVNVDEYKFDVAPGDRILLCSDGLTEMVADDAIAAIVADRTPEEAVWALVELANEAGGVDNITVAVIEAQSSSAS
ncbi:MAG TPA: Stp1/IreP family PP2C-type Ser/Thr phosphatase [Acidimicrobiia bacterium]|nr:Stp1/IreP family PP2C-type Ser/Thr phosphatase [Acidimicrobiia bacterium]